MKKKNLMMTLLSLASAACIVYACQKDDSKSNLSNSSGLGIPPPALNSNTAGRFNGTQEYYSKNTGDTVYKMVVVSNNDGEIDIDRSIYSTSRPDTFQTRFYIDPSISVSGLTWNSQKSVYTGDTLIWPVTPSNKTYYVIPMNPVHDPVAHEDGSGGGKLYCQTNCLQYSEECQLYDLNWVICFSWDCRNCTIMSDGCGGVPHGGQFERVSKYGGVLLIEGTSIHVTN